MYDVCRIYKHSEYLHSYMYLIHWANVNQSQFHKTNYCIVSILLLSDYFNTSAQTDEIPFSVRYEAGCVSAVTAELQVNAGTVVRPRTELDVTLLLVERKPCDVHLARAQEQPGRHPEAVTLRRHYDVRRIPAVEIPVGAKHEQCGNQKIQMRIFINPILPLSLVVQN